MWNFSDAYFFNIGIHFKTHSFSNEMGSISLSLTLKGLKTQDFLLSNARLDSDLVIAHFWFRQKVFSKQNFQTDDKLLTK